MKDQLKKFTLILILCSTSIFELLATTNYSNTLYATQPKANSVFSFFRTHRNGKASITSAWGVANGNGIVSFRIIKTYEDPAEQYAYWETVATIAYTGASSYKFTDPTVFPGYISYKIIAVLTDGSEMTTVASTVHIVSH
jgi:hypothetical protein